MESFTIKIVEAMDIPKDYETDFLGYIAGKLGLQFPDNRIFTERLSEDNLEKDWRDIARLLNPKVTEDEELLKLAENTRKTWSKEICNALKELGFSYEKGAKQLWQPARQWLAQTQFGPWLWEQLTQKSQKTDQMGVKDPRSGEHLGMLPKNDYLDKVTLNREIIFEIQLPQPGHLTLLEREPNGKVVCLCPSHLAQKSQFTQKSRVVLPQRNNSCKVFQPNELGTEQLLALVTPESPGFDWLEKSRQEAMQLQPSHLQQMFEYVKQQPQARLLYTEYQVVE
jgi:hypothetical protein